MIHFHNICFFLYNLKVLYSINHFIKNALTIISYIKPQHFSNIVFDKAFSWSCSICFSNNVCKISIDKFHPSTFDSLKAFLLVLFYSWLVQLPPIKCFCGEITRIIISATKVFFCQNIHAMKPEPWVFIRHIEFWSPMRHWTIFLNQPNYFFMLLW